MIQVLTYPENKLPKAYKQQILSFQRIVWTEGFVGRNLYRDWIDNPQDHSLHFLLVNPDKEVLVSHLSVVWKRLAHCGINYRVYGLTGVFTYPAFRQKNYGKRLVRFATSYILHQTKADLAMFNCDDAVVEFYRKAGWEILAGAPTTLIKTRGGTVPSSSKNLMLKLISKKAKEHQADFLKEAINFQSDSTW